MENKPLYSLLSQTKLLPSMAYDKRRSDIEYLKELKSFDLLLPFYMVAHQRVGGPGDMLMLLPNELHWGWESPLSDIRGHFMGSFLSAAAQLTDEEMDQELLGKANYLVDEIGKCQKINGGEWAFPIPEEYLYNVRDRDDNNPMTPIYVCHKTMMGLLDMYIFAGNRHALDIAIGCANWFIRYTESISDERMNRMMDMQEPGGIMEFWADLFAVTKNEAHLQLMRRYERRKLFSAMLEGYDVLTNTHANSVIPEIHGAARAYEVTGELRYRKVVENFWDMAVTKRGSYATGGQTSGEVWSPMQKQASRLGSANQEHCVVYQMIRLADYIFRWTGNAKYMNYIERNIYNGLFAQGFCRDDNYLFITGYYGKRRGLISYYLPLRAGSKKAWGSPTGHFWCCHATLVQANAKYRDYIFYRDGDGILISQYFPAKTTFETPTGKVEVLMEQSNLSGYGTFDFATDIETKPEYQSFDVRPGKGEYSLKFRIPDWLTASMTLKINGKETAYQTENGFAVIQKSWEESDTVTVIQPRGLYTYPLPDEPDTVAFMDGPVLLAGIIPEERALCGDKAHPESMLKPQSEREWMLWRTEYRTVNQPVGFYFKPLYDIFDENYTIYFPIEQKK